MIMYEYDAGGVLREREATQDEEAVITEYQEAQQRPFRELQEQINEQTASLDDIILIMADMIGGN